MRNTMKWLRINMEWRFWSVALAALTFTDPHSATHFTICPIAQMGFDFCPDCGLGRSIALLMNGSIMESFEMHALGIPALIIITFRWGQLTLNIFQKNLSKSK
jgi:hypothetical protein